MVVSFTMSGTAQPILEFGEFRLDARTRELWRRNAPVHISPKTFELLLHLLEQRPRALSRNAAHCAPHLAEYVHL